VTEAPITRDELYVADEIFLTGTAAEVTPVREVDHRQIGPGKRGPITKTLQDAFFDVVAGRDRKHERWLTYV
jgi:branched-chain amino acid aminotransferase